MAEIRFVVKFYTTPEEETAWVNGLYDDFEQAKAMCQTLVDTEADEAWIELEGYPEMHADSFHAPEPPPPLPAPEPEPEPELVVAKVTKKK